MKKVTFFFGSGADTDYCSRLPSGEEFSSALLSDNFKKARTAMLGEETANLYLISHNSQKFFLQTICNQYNCDDKKLKDIFGTEVIEKCSRVYDSADNVSDQDRTDVKDYCQEWYHCIKEHSDHYVLFKKKSAEIRKFFLKYGQFFDTLDEKFNSLRFYKKSNNAKRVKNAYAAVFCLMLSILYENRFRDSADFNYGKIFELLQDEYTCEKSSKTTYYDLLGNYIAETGKDNSWIVTSNYTLMAEKCIQNKVRDIAVTYLHGKLTWFEDLEKLTVYDVTVKSEREEVEAILKDEQDSTELDEQQKLSSPQGKIIPFILIPSGVKPLICTRQVEEFHRFIEALDKSDELCVIGYRFNSEDNHINSIIGNWLRKDSKHKLIFFNYGNSIVISRLRWLFNIKIENDAEIEKIDSYSAQVINVEVGQNDAVKKFDEYLKRCKGQSR